MPQINPALQMITPDHLVEIFIAYSREDANLLKGFLSHLSALELAKKVKIWYDAEIDPGADWQKEIKDAINNADIIILLVSSDSINSRYFVGEEMTRAFERHDKGEATLIPLIIRACTWQFTRLGDIQALPQNGEPVTSPKWKPIDEAWKNATNSINTIVEKHIAKKKNKIVQEDQIKRKLLEEENLRKKIAEELQRRENFDTVVGKANQLFASSRWKQAETAYQTALELYKKGDSPNSDTLKSNIQKCMVKKRAEERAEKYVRLARQLIEEGELRFALVYIDKALQAYPKNAEAVQLKEEIGVHNPRQGFQFRLNKSTLRNLGVITLGVLILLLLLKQCTNITGCNSMSTPKSCLDDSLPTRKNVLAEMHKRDTIRIIVEPDAPPFNYLDEKNHPAGFDYEVAKKIAAELGITQVEMLYGHGLDYSEFPCAFNQGIADWFMGGYVRNSDFDNLVSWSDSYYQANGLALIVKKGSGITKATQLRNKNVAVYNDPSSIEFVRGELGGIVKPCTDTLEQGTWISKELDTLGMAAVVYDYPFAAQELKDLDPDHKKYKMVEFNLYNMPYVIGLPKGNDDLLREVNQAISTIVTDKVWYEKIIKDIIPPPPPSEIGAKIYVPPGFKSHIVKPGETLSGIVHDELGWPAIRWHEAWEWNKSNIPNPHMINPGDIVLIKKIEE